jgi:hypothetical protein
MKKDDWVIHEYSIKQVLEAQDGRVTEVSDGSFRTSGYDLECFPLDLRNKRLAEYVEYYEREVRKMDPGGPALNWPDIHRHFCYLAAEAIRSKTAKQLEAIQEQTKKFAFGIIDGIRESRKLVLDEVRVFGR